MVCHGKTNFSHVKRRFWPGLPQENHLFAKGAWTILLQTALNKYNEPMKHTTTDMTPDEAHKDENAVKVKANSVLKEKYLRKYPKVEVGDKVKVFVKGKGNMTSRKESRNQWSEQTYTVKEIARDLQLKHYILEGKAKKYIIAWSCILVYYSILLYFIEHYCI